MKVTPRARRSSTTQTSDGLEISIPARKHLFALVFMPMWLIGWSVGELSAIRELVSGDGSPMFFLGTWLTLWTLGGGAALFTWLWMIRGREIIRLRYHALVIRRDLLGLGREKEFDLSHVTNLRVALPTWTPFDWNAAMQPWGQGTGRIAFDYGADTIRIGSGIDEAEARQIVGELKSRHAFAETARSS